MTHFDRHHARRATYRAMVGTLILLAAAAPASCGSGRTPSPPESRGTAVDTPPASTPAPAAAAPPADTAPPSPDAWPARRVLDENSLAVAVYRPGDPAACGLPAVQPGDGRATVMVFHACEPRSGPYLDAVPARRVAVPAGADPMAAAVRAQLAGPTEAERGAGYQSNFGPGTASTPFAVRRLEGGLAVVDLHPSILRQPMAFVSNAEAKQLVAALGQLPGVERVAILVGGQPLCRALEMC